MTDTKKSSGTRCVLGLMGVVIVGGLAALLIPAAIAPFADRLRSKDTLPPNPNNDHQATDHHGTNDQPTNDHGTTSDAKSPFSTTENAQYFPEGHEYHLQNDADGIAETHQSVIEGGTVHATTVAREEPEETIAGPVLTAPR